MLNVFSKKRAAAALDLSSELIVKTVLSADGERFLLEDYEFFSADEAAQKLASLKRETITATLSDCDAVCFAAPDADENSFEIECRKKGIDAFTNYAKLLKISTGGLLIAADRERADEAAANIEFATKGSCDIRLSHSTAAAFYVFLRCYKPHPNLKTALLCFTSKTISAVVLNGEQPLWSGFVKPTNKDKEEDDREVYAMLRGAAQKLGFDNYDLLLLAGECGAEDSVAMMTFAFHAELFNPFRSGAFEISDSLYPRLSETQSQAHRLAAAIGAAGMELEGIELNLADEESAVVCEMPLERYVENEETALAVFQEQIAALYGKAVPLLFAQGRAMLTALLISLAFIGYRYYSTTRETARLEAETAKEQVRAASLADIRAKRDEYKSKTASIRARTDAINAIRKEQMTVKTVLDELDLRIPSGVIFSELEAQERLVKLKGYAPDRSAVNALATMLGQSVGVFADVVPVYDDKTNAGNYELTFKYVGAVQPSPMATGNR